MTTDNLPNKYFLYEINVFCKQSLCFKVNNIDNLNRQYNILTYIEYTSFCRGHTYRWVSATLS